MSLRSVVRNRTAQVRRQDLEDALQLCRSVRRSDPGKLLQAASYAREKGEQEGFDDIVIQALLYCAEASHRLGRHDATHAFLQKAESILPPSASSHHRLSLHHAWGLHYLELGDFGTAHDHLYRTLQLSEVEADAVARCNALNSLGLVFARIGDCEAALRFYFAGLEIAEGEKDCEATPSILTNIGTAYGLLGDQTKGLEYFERSLAIRTLSNDAVGIGTTLKNIATLYRRRGDFQRALEYFERSLAIWREIGNGKKEANILANIGIAYAELGRHRQALSIIQESVRYAQRTKNSLEYAFALSKLGWIYQMLNEHDKGLSALTKSLHLFQKLKMREYEYTLHKHLAEIHEARGDFRKGLEHHKRYIAIREEVRGVEKQRSIATMEIRRALRESEREKEELRAQAKEARREMERRGRESNGIASTLTRPDNQIPRHDEKSVGRNASHILEQIERVEEEEKKSLSREHPEQLYREFIRPLRRICPDLTPTEIRICVLIKLNFSTRQIAETLFTSPLTVKTHRTHIRRKLGVKNGQNLANLFLAM